MEKANIKYEGEIKDLPTICKLNEDKITPILRQIKNDKDLMEELHKLGILDEEIPSYISLLSDYQENKKLVKENPDAMLMILEISDAGKLTFHYEESKKSKELSSMQRNFLICDYENEFVNARLTSKGTTREKDFVKNIKSAIKEKKWLYVYGSSGSGKSYYLAAILNMSAIQGDKVAFLNANKRFEELKSLAIKNKEEFDKTLDALSKVKYLVIDDFGSEFKSDYVRDIVIMPLLNNRSKNRLFTAFTSDMNLDELEQIYDYKYGAKIYAKKLVSLIRNNLEKPNGYSLEKGLENLILSK